MSSSSPPRSAAAAAQQQQRRRRQQRQQRVNQNQNNENGGGGGMVTTTTTTTAVDAGETMPPVSPLSLSSAANQPHAAGAGRRQHRYNSATPTSVVAAAAHDNDDDDDFQDASAIADDDDDHSQLSTLSQRSWVSQVTHVVHDATKILMGEDPNATIDEEDDATKLENFVSFSASLSSSDRNRGAMNNTNSSHTTTAINFTQDPLNTMTWSRRIALYLSKRYAWYNPRLKKAKAATEGGGTDHDVDIDDEEPLDRTRSYEILPGEMNDAYPFTKCRREKPSLERAWAYFEHVSLPRFVMKPKEGGDDGVKKHCCRRVVNKFRKGDKQLERAEPGEKYMPTKLYDPIFTPHKQLGDWGLGFGLYFSTLRAITVITLLAGCLNLPNIVYFRGPEYSNNQIGVRDLVKGSAICTVTEYVPLVFNSSNPAETGIIENSNRVATSELVNGTTLSGLNVTFGLKNQCDGATLQQGMINYGTLFFVVVGIACLNLYLARMEIAFDEDEQTAQDYSIVITNPPPDATDPEEWRAFFYDQFDKAHVTTCTVAVDNDLLVRSLVERREKLKQIAMMVEPGTSLDTLTVAGIAAEQENKRRFFGRMKAALAPGVPELFSRVVVLNAKVQGLSQRDSPATRVFIAFETEADQRLVLAALTSKQKQSDKRNMLFRGEHILHVNEPSEPNTVRWQDLNEKFNDRLKQQGFTMFATLAAIALIAFIVKLCNDKSVVFSAFAIAIFNTLFPMMAKALTDMEAHASEDGKQTSLYLKIAIFRWVNTAIVISVIFPFTDTLTNTSGLIDQVYALFFAEIVTTNAVQLLDPAGHLQRHFLAPRAPTQDAMNILFKGQAVELAERYTNMTKLIFLTVWYCAIYPAAFFMCSLALFINYFTDRFSLMRTWKRAPQLGTNISLLSRRTFMSLSVVAMAIISSYNWAGFPFDNLCVNEELVPTQYVGVWLVQPLDGGDPVEVTVTPTDKSYGLCLQDFFRFPSGADVFPFVAANQLPGMEWMTQEQETVTTIYGWTSVGVVAAVLLVFVWRLFRGLMNHFYGSHTTCGDDQGIGFSEVPSISTYIPEVESPLFSYPLLACKIDGLDEELFDWTDPDRPHYYYDLTKDAEVLLRGLDISSKSVFSRISHWPPPPKTGASPNKK